MSKHEIDTVVIVTLGKSEISISMFTKLYMAGFRRMFTYQQRTKWEQDSVRYTQIGVVLMGIRLLCHHKATVLIVSPATFKEHQVMYSWRRLVL